MDMDFRAARVHRRLPSIQSSRLGNSGNHLLMEDEGVDEVRAWFPCPFCYVEIEVPLLCVHLQEEHCFDLKNAVCPICAANLGKDALGHFVVQHAHSIKRRKRSLKSGSSNESKNIIRDLRDTSSFFGDNSQSGPGGEDEPAPDPLLLPFLCAVPTTVFKESEKDIIPCVAETSGAESCKSSSPGGLEERDYEERRQHAAFLQELILSTIL